MLPCREVLSQKVVRPKGDMPDASHSHMDVESPDATYDTHFASSGASGVVDLGASQTVIGSNQVTELLQGLPDQIRAQVRRTPCQLTFRFGNHQTLMSKHALLLPLCGQWFRIAVVPGPTPFVLSSTFLKQIRAVIDTDEGTMYSKVLHKNLPMERSAENLFLMDVNQLWSSSTEGDSAAQTFASETESKHQPSESSVVEADPCVVSCKETIMRSQENNHNNSNSFRASEFVHSVSSCEKHMCTEDVGPKSSISTSLPGRFNVQSSSHAQGAEECSRPRSSGDDDAGRALHGESDVRGLGESKKGCTFEQAFQDAQWTEFILNRFEKSTKPEHRMYVRFVELKLKEMSTGNTAIKTKNTKKMPETSQAEPVPFDVWEELQSMEGEPIMEAPMLKEEMADLRQTNQNPSNRMSQVETVMSELLEHVRKLTVVKNEA